MAGRSSFRSRKSKYMKDVDQDQDFDEGEIWGFMEDNNNNNNKSIYKENTTTLSSSKLRKKPLKNIINKDSSSSSSSSSTSSSSSSSRNLCSTTPRMIPRSSSPSSTTKQFSAPLDIPDWSKIYGKSSSCYGNKHNDITCSSSSSSYHDHHHHHHHEVFAYNGCHYHDHDVDDDDDGDGMLPPHEYIARKLARSQISSFSVCEGIGRTLKGRDLKKLRNAILSKTGFLE